MFITRLLPLTVVLFAGCETQRVEYHTRPAWHYSMISTLQNEVVREDGTIVKYAAIGGNSSKSVKEYLDSVVLEEKNEVTGDITLRAILPEHLLTQTLVCLRDRNWDLLHEQILSSSAKQYFETRDNGRIEFESFFENNRRELAKTIQRMIQGKAFGDVFVSEDRNYMVLTFSPKMVGKYVFKKVTLYREGEFLKLQSIE